MKTLHCRDVGFECTHVIQAETEEQVLVQAVQHAAEVHRVTVTNAMAQQVRTLVCDCNDAVPGASYVSQFVDVL